MIGLTAGCGWSRAIPTYAGMLMPRHLLFWIVALVACGEPKLSGPTPPARPSGTPELPTLPDRAPTADCLADVVAGGEPPTWLMATGCVESMEPLVLSPELLPYGIASPLFSDHTRKLRWIAVPPGGTVSFGEEGQLSAPAGTRLAKLFARPTESGDPIPLELRFAVQLVDEVRFFSYRFEGGDGRLLDASETVDFEVPGGLRASYLFPARASCTTCHSNAAPLLGPSDVQLAIDVRYGDGEVEDQLGVWRALGLVEERSDVSPMPSPTDTTAPIEARARAYLHANCGGCHRPGGFTPPDVDLDLRWSTPMEDTRTRCVFTQYPGLAGEGMRLDPHDPNSSAIVRRMRALDDEFPSPMPPLGRSLPDTFGGDLVAEWAASLPPCE